MGVRFQILDSRVVLIVDYMFYGSKIEEIDEWCWQQFGYHPRGGMIMTFKNEKDISLFMLRWA